MQSRIHCQILMLEIEAMPIDLEAILMLLGLCIKKL